MSKRTLLWFFFKNTVRNVFQVVSSTTENFFRPPYFSSKHVQRDLQIRGPIGLRRGELSGADIDLDGR